jgi:hypothetical protein
VSAAPDTPLPVLRRHVLGLDLGQSADPTALAVLEDSEHWSPEAAGWEPRYAVRHLQRWPLKTKFPAIVRDVGETLRSKALRDPLLVIDGTGVGQAVGDLFEDVVGAVPMRRVIITAGSKVNFEDGTWRVPKKELVSVLQVLLQSRRITIARLPERETLVRELMAFRVKITAAMNETFESWRERDHDDLVLAVALAAWAAEDTAGGGAGVPFAVGQAPGYLELFHNRYDHPRGP